MPARCQLARSRIALSVSSWATSRRTCLAITGVRSLIAPVGCKSRANLTTVAPGVVSASSNTPAGRAGPAAIATATARLSATTAVSCSASSSS